MTLLNTLCNLGGNWPSTIVLWLVDVLTWRKCDLDEKNVCFDKSEKEVDWLKLFYLMIRIISFRLAHQSEVNASLRLMATT